LLDEGAVLIVCGTRLAVLVPGYHAHNDEHNGYDT